MSLDETTLKESGTSSKKDKKKKKGVAISPLTAAIIAGLVGLLGTMLGGILNIQVERQKQEGSLILEGIKTGDTKAAARNLLFFSEAGLIHLSKSQVDKLKAEAGTSTLPVLPPTNAAPERINFMPSAVLNEDIKKTLESVLTSYQAYMQKLGYKPKGNEVAVAIKPLSEMLDIPAYYDSDKNTMFIAAPYVNDTDLALREYMHRVLYPAWFSDKYSDKLEYVSIEWGLATYYPCSFKNNPVFGNISASIDKSVKALNLINNGKFTRMRPDDYQWVDETQEVWGAAFWEIRQLVGQDVGDKLLFSSWNSITESDVQLNDPKSFVRKILEMDQSTESGRHSNEIRAIFVRRGLAL